MSLPPASATAIEARLRQVEAATGVQVVAALIRRSSRYHGLRWRAFALGAVLAALATVLEDRLHPAWLTGYTALFNAMVIIGAGMTCAVVATFVPPFERLFLQRTRAEAEMRQRAQVLFLQRQLFATPGRNAVLLLSGAFERAVAVYADTGFATRLREDDWQPVVVAMTPLLRAGERDAAYLAGLDALQALLLAKGYDAAVADSNVLADQVVDIEDDPT